MKKLKKLLTFIVSLVVTAIGVIILVLVSLVSICINSCLFIFMVIGLSIPVLGNKIAGMIKPDK